MRTSWRWVGRLAVRVPGLAVAVLVLGLLAAVAAGSYTYLAVEHDAENGFRQAVAAPVVLDVSERLRAYSDVLYAVRGLFDASGEVTRTEFHRFSEGLAIAQRYPGLTNINYAAWVPHTRKGDFERAVREESGALFVGLPRFEITPPGERPEYVVLNYIEPLRPNITGWGLDLLAEPIRRAAVIQARDSGRLSASQGVRLYRDAGTPETSVLLRLAIYRTGEVPPTESARRREFVGAAGLAIRTSELMDSTLARHRSGIMRVTVHAPGGELLFDSIASRNAPSAVRDAERYARYTVALDVPFGDQKWGISVTPLDDPVGTGHRLLPYAVSAILFGATLLFAAFIRSLRTSELRARALEQSMRETAHHALSLTEAQEIAGVGSWEWDDGAQAMTWSSQLYRVFGREPGDPPAPTFEFLAREVLLPEDVPLVREAIRTSLSGVQPGMCEFRIRRPDGEIRVLSTRASVDPDGRGRVKRLKGTVLDITERKAAQAQLAATVEELTRKNREAATLAKLVDALQSCLTVVEAYDVLAKMLPTLLPDTAGAIYVLDTGHARAEIAVRWGDAPDVEEVFIANDCLALRRGQTRCVTDAAQEANCKHFTDRVPASYACVPLLAHGEILGLLHMQQAPGAAACDPEHVLPLVQSIAENIALSLANLALRERLRQQATRDPLTGLYNRHYMQEWLDLELHRARRQGRMIGAIMFDIDHFKRFNDTFGHEAGDTVLREVGALLMRHARRSDVACRYGGEELLLLLPEADRDATLRRAEEVRHAIGELRLEHAGRALGTVSVSGGVALFPLHAEDAGALLRRADEALYVAKRTGRNRVVQAEMVEPAPTQTKAD